ncbi:concanavalin A-like lectin/glucanase domain-containing protein [Apiosordaria backusii]|uniref:Concanavalin A-like lectin/glucanase domain-containing protein n=1 Tax=Apiosordaria backusii TaxID=314023 RepID=A0AA39ZSS7_9PEZI|nr:concanavalin A-like lectin/glucanase domain-containing protein [Apiosordaria backusii]
MNLRLITSALVASHVLAFGINAADDISSAGSAIQAFNTTSNSTSFVGNGDTIYTTNWAGMTLSRTPDVLISSVQGNFTLPTIAPTDKLQYVELTVGIDGSFDCNTSFIVAGIAIKNNAGQPTPLSYRPFWKFNTGVKNIVDPFDLAAGDQIGVQITVKSKTTVSIEFYNARTKARYVTDWTNEKGLCLLNANWLVQRADEADVFTAGQNQGPATEHLVQMMVEKTNWKSVVWCYMAGDREPVKGLRCNRMAD